MSQGDPRRATPRTDQVLADPRLVAAAERLGRSLVKRTTVTVLARCRAGLLAPEDVADATVAALPTGATSLRPVLNATGVVVHTNIGRAPLSTAALQAVTDAAGYGCSPAAIRGQLGAAGTITPLRDDKRRHGSFIRFRRRPCHGRAPHVAPRILRKGPGFRAS